MAVEQPAKVVMLLVAPESVPLTFAENAVFDVSDPETFPLRVPGTAKENALHRDAVVGLLPPRASAGVTNTEPSKVLAIHGVSSVIERRGTCRCRTARCKDVGPGA